MHFCLLDQVVELSDRGIVTLKCVSAGEEYLQDHFPGFPVLPGVMMIEAMVQGARHWVEQQPWFGGQRYVLGAVRALKYGSFVRPGELLRVTLWAEGPPDGDGAIEFKGSGEVIRPGVPDAPSASCVSGRLMLRPVRV